MEFLESLYLVADLLEAAAVAVCSHSFKDLGKSLGDIPYLLGIFPHLSVIRIINSCEDDPDGKNVRVLFILFDI